MHPRLPGHRSASCALIVGIVACMLTLNGTQSGSAAAVTWSIASGGNGHAYEFVDALVWWDEARIASAARTPPDGYAAGSLVTIASALENAFVVQLIPDSSGSWIGFTDQALEGEWRWIDDTPGRWQDPVFFVTPIQTAYVNWATGEPNNHIGDEDYGLLRSDAFWNDGQGPMSGSKGAYIVEYAPVIEPPLSAVPEIATCHLGNVFAIIFGLIGLLERRRLRAGISH
jgi:hypothetical protein